MPYSFRPAVRTQTPLLLGVAGPSGSGKTLSALRLARGILGGDEGIFMVDTEANRGLHYACAPGERPGPFLFHFQHCSMGPPFSPAAYRDALGAAVSAGARAVIVDSTSHVHEGEGGILEMHEAALNRMAGDDYKKRERVTFAAWIQPKSEHGKLVNWILQQNCHFIFCFRAKDKMKLVKKDNKTEPVQLGWTPICSDRFEYEMTTLLMLPPNARGVPDLDLESTKINAHHLAFIRKGQPLDESVGAALAQWARGGTAPTAEKPQSQQSSDEAIVTIDGKQYKTKGVTQAQFDEIRRLEEMVDRIHGEGTAAKFLAQDHRVTKRLHLTLDSARHYIRTLQLQSGEPVEE